MKSVGETYWTCDSMIAKHNSYVKGGVSRQLEYIFPWGNDLAFECSLRKARRKVRYISSASSRWGNRELCWLHHFRPLKPLSVVENSTRYSEERWRCLKASGFRSHIPEPCSNIEHGFQKVRRYGEACSIFWNIYRKSLHSSGTVIEFRTPWPWSVFENSTRPS